VQARPGSPLRRRIVEPRRNKPPQQRVERPPVSRPLRARVVERLVSRPLRARVAKGLPRLGGRTHLPRRAPVNSRPTRRWSAVLRARTVPGRLRAPEAVRPHPRGSGQASRPPPVRRRLPAAVLRPLDPGRLLAPALRPLVPGRRQAAVLRARGLAPQRPGQADRSYPAPRLRVAANARQVVLRAARRRSLRHRRRSGLGPRSTRSCSSSVF
jgi:hypothetical protein